MLGSMPKNGSPRRAPMPQTRRKGAYPSFFEDIWIKAIYLIALIALYFALAKTYTEFLQPLYSYNHFKQHFVPTRELESLTVLSVAAAVMPANFRRPCAAAWHTVLRRTRMPARFPACRNDR